MKLAERGGEVTDLHRRWGVVINCGGDDTITHTTRTRKIKQKLIIIV